MKFRTMELADIPAGVSLCRSAGWNQLSRDWEIFLKLDPQGNSVCADDVGNVVGTVTTIRYGNQLAWIGMLLVDPAHQRRGIGLRLLEQASLALAKEPCVKLDATPAGRQVYVKLGFHDEYELSRMFTSSLHIEQLISSPTVTPLGADDLELLKVLDGRTFGADRMVLLSWMLDGAPALAFKVTDGDEIQGYCLGRMGHRYAHIGPVVAANVEVAKRVVSAALIHCENRPVIMDVPHHDASWQAWLASVGFVTLRPFIRMYRGVNPCPGIPENQYAILGPEFG